MNVEQNSHKKTIWKNIIFFSITTVFAVVGCPIYLHYYDLSAFEIGLTLFYLVATALGITVGYHRLFSHVTFKAHPIIRFLMLFFGAAAFEQSALTWSAQHRDHHRYVDTPMDPYSIKKGFFYAHIGWMIFWKHKIHFENAQDLQNDPMVMHQHKNYIYWAFISGAIIPTLIGAFFGHAIGAFLFACCFRITFVYHSTFCINSVCHMFGKSTYDVYATARDHWFVALLTFGEGYHNYHHRFPTDYRNGILWYHWDPSKWLIRLMACTGLAWDLKRISRFRVLEAKLAGEAKLAQDRLLGIEKTPAITKAIELLHAKQALLKRNLFHWEEVMRGYQTTFQEKVATHSHDIKQMWSERIQDAQDRFQQAHREWDYLMQQHPMKLQKLLLVPA